MESDKKSNGALIGLVVIVIILVIGGIYIWQSNNNTTGSQQQGTLTSQDAAQLNTLEQNANATDPNTGVNINNVR
jgi:uncharacterized protein HemX